MNYYTNPEMKITYFGEKDTITTNETPVVLVSNYAANNMNSYMTGTVVKAIQTRTAAVKDVMNFTN